MGAEAKGKILDGIKHYNEGEYERALIIFKELSDKESTDMLAQFYLGSTFGSLGRFSEAICSFDSILTVNPKHEKALKAKQIFETMERNSTGGATVGSHDIMVPACPSPQAVKCSAEMEDVSTYRSATTAELSGPDEKIPEMSALHESTLYEFLKSSEAERFLASGEGNNPEINNVIDNIGTNAHDKSRLLELIREGSEDNLRRFIGNVRLRNRILDYLADSNTLPPRKYNTITTQIKNINAEFGLAFLMFNLGEQKYCEIIGELAESLHSHQDQQDHDAPNESEKIGILKVISNFFIGMFSFEKSFEDEFNKLKYFQYLFMFLGFIGVLVLIGYGIKNDLFRIDISATRTTGSGASTTEIHSNL